MQKKKTLKKWMFQDKPIIKTIVEANNIHYIQTSCKTIDKQDMIIIWRLWSLPNRPLTLSTHILNFDDIGQCWIFTPHFYAVFWQPFWKWQTSWKFWIAPLMLTYHYVKFYVSIIIQLEVINMHVRNFKFPIGFYSNPHPLWTPKI